MIKIFKIKIFKIKKICFLMILLFTMIFFAVSCSKETEEPDGEPSLLKDAKGIYQFNEPKKGDLIAQIEVGGYGTISIKLFPEQAPKAVENFKALASEGYYDNQIFFRIIKNYLVQGGDSSGDGTGGASIWGKHFEDEITELLQPFRGALCMANEGEPDTNGSQFFLIQANADSVASLDELLAFKGYGMAEYIASGYGTYMSQADLSNYYKYGGAPWLYGHHTVFGQIYDGFEVLDAIAAVSVKKDSYRPLEDININTIKIFEKEE